MLYETLCECARLCARVCLLCELRVVCEQEEEEEEFIQNRTCAGREEVRGEEGGVYYQE